MSRHNAHLVVGSYFIAYTLFPFDLHLPIYLTMFDLNTFIFDLEMIV